MKEIKEKYPNENDEIKDYGMGFKIYKFKNKEDEIIYGLGHPGISGSVALTIPDLSLSMAINVSLIDIHRITSNSIIKEICKYFNIIPLSKI